jgi:hypothetical protein
MRRILLAYLMIAPCLFVYGGQEERNCQEVGGAIFTTFISPPNPAATSLTKTLGTVTGDLKGATGLENISMTPGPNGIITFRNRHLWVTESGEAIYAADGDAPAIPIPGMNGLFFTRYTGGVPITGGTGRFAGATGNLDVYGTVDFRDPKHAIIILHYQGEICFADHERH